MPGATARPVHHGRLRTDGERPMLTCFLDPLVALTPCQWGALTKLAERYGDHVDLEVVVAGPDLAASAALLAIVSVGDDDRARAIETFYAGLTDGLDPRTPDGITQIAERLGVDAEATAIFAASGTAYDMAGEDAAIAAALELTVLPALTLSWGERLWHLDLDEGDVHRLVGEIARALSSQR
ncbi:MAG: hypothetical protein LWW86_05340 [Micrococcales bacterium]|nr:hypothetical protein [Micrococcales bacterium]